jgi:hypothetical protein
MPTLTQTVYNLFYFQFQAMNFPQPKIWLHDKMADLLYIIIAMVLKILYNLIETPFLFS